MELFIFGSICGGVMVGAAMFLIHTRYADRKIDSWAEMLAEQQRSNSGIHEPRAVTKLTHRERTITL